MSSPSCSICGNMAGNQQHVAREMMFGLRNEFRYLECGACRCVQLVDVPADLSKYYPPSYYSFASLGGLRGVINRRRALQAHGERSVSGWLAEQLLGPYYAMEAIRRAQIPLTASILDVGCGSGSLIRDMKRLGYEHVFGVDPYIAKDLCYDDGVTVVKRTLAEMTGAFDIVMLHHAFEHMPEPANALTEMRRLLRPNGRIQIRIPIADSDAWRRYGVNWMHLDAPRHLFLHTPASMRQLAAQAGLLVTKVIFEGNASQFIGSEQYQRDIPLADPRSVYSGGARRWVGWWKARRLQARAEELNRAGQGDWGCFDLQRSIDSGG
jgi:SAM-dependent methyltransferase